MKLVLLVALSLVLSWGTVCLAAVDADGLATTPAGQRYAYSAAASPGPAPVLVFLHGNERAGRDTVEQYRAQWQAATQQAGWHLVLPWTESRYSFLSDTGVQAVERVLQDFARSHAIDPQRVYLVGHGDSAPAVFYTLSRLPDLWAAGLAIGGDAGRAIESNRLFAANAANSPVLWIYEKNRESLLARARQQLQNAGVAASFLTADEFRVEQAMEWLSQHKGIKLPLLVEYESGDPAFTGAWWAHIRDFDFTLRNDVLPSSRVDPGTGAFLRLGGFGYDPDGKGPGLLVKWLPDNYKGPLRLDDQIVSIAGTMIEDATHYAEFMESQLESRDVGIIIRRNGKSMRVETRIVIPKREETDTARVRAEYIEDVKEVLVVSRGARAIELRIPATWAPVKLSWNGQDVRENAEAGCWVMMHAAELSAIPCEQSSRDAQSGAATSASGPKGAE